MDIFPIRFHGRPLKDARLDCKQSCPPGFSKVN